MKTIKHIGFISPSLYPDKIGGMEVFNYYLILELSKEYYLTLYTTNKYLMSKNVKVESISSKLIGSHGFKITFQVKTLIRILFSKEKPDVIHIPFTSTAKYYGLTYSLLWVLFKIPYVITIHGGSLRPWKPQWMYSQFFKNSSKIVAVSETIKKEYEKRTRKEVNVILPLIPFKNTGKTKKELRALFNIPSNKFVILFLGTLKDLKRPIDVITALKILTVSFLQNNDILTIFVGEGPQREYLEKKAIDNKLSSFIRFIGQVPFDETPNYYELSDLYIIPSKFEGTSKSLVGAMYYGLPVIGSDVNGINSIIKNKVNGLLFPLYDADKLAICIKNLIYDEYLRKSLSIEVKNTYLKNYSFKKTVSDYIDTYYDSLK